MFALPLFVLTLQAQPVDYTSTKIQLMGKHVAEDVLKRSPAVESQVMQDYANRIGVRLAAHLPGAPFRFTVFLNTSGPLQEPLFLPDAHILVPIALLADVASEDEFAAILAHSMAHVTQGHGIRKSGNSIPLVFIGNGFKSLPDASEQEADRTAVRAISEAGYNPGALCAYLQRVDPKSSRIAALGEAAVTMATGEFAQIQAQARGIVAPPRRTPTLVR